MAQAKGVFNFVAMLLALAAIGGFLYWLSIAAEPTQVAVAEEEVTAQALSLAAFAQNPIMYEGDLIAVDDVEIGEMLGSQVFFAAFPEDTSYPIRLDPSLGAMGGQLTPSTRARVTGTVHALTDSIIDVWAAESVFADDAQRDAAAGSSSFLLATEVEIVPQAEPQGTAGGA